MQEYFIILFPAFLLGVLHTAIPCEDKAIFLFFSSGIAKSAKKRFIILSLYGIGLMAANMIIATIVSLVSLLPRVFGFEPDPYASNFLGALSSMFVAIGLLFFVTYKDYLPHSGHGEEIMDLNWDKLRTPYLFGILTGFPPCIFELFIYSQCATYSLSYSPWQGWLTVLYFSLGTFIGLYPLALAQYGTSQIMGSRDTKSKKIYYIMIIIIIAFNVVIMICSFFRIDVFRVSHI